MDKDFSMQTWSLYENQKNHIKAARNRVETFKLMDKHGLPYGNVLDIGERNYFTELIEGKYGIKVYNTSGDLDVEFNCSNLQFDIIHYNNVIEHQFNPLYTLLKIKEVMKDDGYLILGTPIKPNWITFSRCHFHEFDQYRFDKLITRAGFMTLDCVKFWRDINIFGIRGIAGSFFLKQSVYLLKKL